MNPIIILIIKIFAILSIVNLCLIILKIIFSGFKKNYTYIFSSFIISFFLIFCVQKIKKTSIKTKQKELSNLNEKSEQIESIEKLEKKLNSKLILTKEVINNIHKATNYTYNIQDRSCLSMYVFACMCVRACKYVCIYIHV